MEQKGLNYKINQALVENQLRLIRENHHLFEESKSFDLENVFKSKNMREFDENFTCPQFGFSKLEDYYSYPLKKNIQEITVPVLALNSIDDPISPFENLPFSSAKSSENFSLLTTSFGGHNAFIEGHFPTRPYHFTERAFKQFYNVVF